MNITSWITATRPKTLLASIGPVILGLSTAIYYKNTINISIAILTCVCAVLMQVGTNLVNDYFDSKTGVDSANRIGPKRVTTTGEISPHHIKVGFSICFLIAFVIGIVLSIHGGLPIFIIGILSILFAYIYTGGPFPLSHYALGEVLALIFFGPVAVWGTFFLQSKKFYYFPAFIGLGPGFISATIMLINNLRDIESDSKTSKKTIAIIIGQKNARYLCLCFVILSAITPIITAIYQDKLLISIAAITPIIFKKNWSHILNTKIDESLNNSLANTGKYMLVYCLFFSIVLLLCI